VSAPYPSDLREITRLTRKIFAGLSFSSKPFRFGVKHFREPMTAETGLFVDRNSEPVKSFGGNFRLFVRALFCFARHN
jgi:hypothetical protein